MNHSHGIARECLRGSRSSVALSYLAPPPSHTRRLSGRCALISVDVLLRPWSSAPRSFFIGPKWAELHTSRMANASETRIKQESEKTNRKQVKFWGPTTEPQQRPVWGRRSRKMKKMITLLAVLGMALALAPAAQAQVTLSDGHPGDYRIIFVTLGEYGAKSQVIGDYNTFVDDQAALVGSTETKDLVTTWTALGSTGTTSARTNTGTTGAGDDIHIYTPTPTSGTYQLVATSYTDLWDGSILTPIHFGDGTEAGVVGGAQEQVWTGTESDGTIRPVGGDGSYLGSGAIAGGGDGTAAYITLARGGYTDGNWIEGPSDHDGHPDGGRTYTKHFMSMSGVMNPGGATPATMIYWK